MEANNNQQLENGNDLNNINYSQGQDLGNQTPTNYSSLFHEFEHITSFNTTKLEEDFGEIKKKLYSSKYRLLILFIYRFG